MKKLFLVIALFMALTASAQTMIGFRPVYIIPDTSTKFTMQLKKGDLVWVSDVKLMYQLEQGVGIGKKMSYVLASPTRYTQSSCGLLGGFDPTYYVDTATAQNVRGIKTFYNVPLMSIGSNKGNIGIGCPGGAPFSVSTSGQYNVAIGKNSQYAASDASNNVSIGYNSLKENSAGQFNVGVGSYSIYVNTQSRNTSIGHASLFSNTTGTSNTAVGYYSGWGNKSGSGNVYIGFTSGPVGSTSTESNKLYISNVAGGSDTALIYGDFSAKTLQLNAVTTTQKLTLQSDTAVTDPLYTIAVKGAHVYVKIALTGASSARWKQIDN